MMDEKLPIYSDGTGRELVFPGAFGNRERARKIGDRRMPKDLKRAGFKTYVFRSDREIHGSEYFRITYGKEV